MSNVKAQMTNECQNLKTLPAAGKCQMDFRVQNGILKSKTLNWFQGKVQNGILVMPNQALNLIQDLRISASHLSIEFPLNFEFEIWN
jgi:hypothetical protein